MPYPVALSQAVALIAQAEALAAFGAALAGPEGVAPEVSARIAAVTDALDPAALQDLSPQEAGIVRATIRTFFRQALDLLENPGRPAQWSFDDPLILQTIGQSSRLIVQMIAGMAREVPELAARLAEPGRFLDIGSGVGWISIDMARGWPALTVDGFDIFDPALRLAADNLAGAVAAEPGLAGRVSFHNQDAATLQARDHYAAAFLAGPFIPQAAVPPILQALSLALERGGWLFFGLFRAAPAPLPQALLKLRITRSGGHPWAVEEVRAMMAAHGFSVERVVESAGPALLVAGRRL